MSLWRKKSASTAFRRSTSRVGLCWEPGSLSVVALSDPNALHPLFERRTYKIDPYQSEHLDNIATELHQLGLRGASAVGILPFSEYQAHLVDVPNVPAPEMREAIQWKVKDLLTLPLEEYVVDLIPLSFSFASGEAYGAPSAYAITAKKTTVQSLSETAHQLGLTLTAIDVADMGVCYLSKTLQELSMQEHSSSVAVIVLTENEQKILIIRDGILLMARSFAGLATLPIKEDRSDWMSTDFSMLMNELDRSLEYFEGQVKQERPSSMIFLSDVAVDRALFETIEVELGIPSFQLSVANFFEPEPEPKQSSISQMSLKDWYALGAVYRGDQ